MRMERGSPAARVWLLMLILVAMAAGDAAYVDRSDAEAIGDNDNEVTGRISNDDPRFDHFGDMVSDGKLMPAVGQLVFLKVLLKNICVHLTRSACWPKGLYIILSRVSVCNYYISVVVSQIITKFGECVR